MTTTTPQWTEAQRRGIETVGRSLLLSAAAGSGKTAVLAERCAHLVADARPPCRVDQLLVVTFTEAAAAEMKSRIRQALHKRLDRGHDEHLARQLALINHAQISTLHQFCARIVRQHFHLLQLDPHFCILDEDEARLLRLETVRNLFHDHYESDESGQFQKLIDNYGDGYDQALMKHVVRTHELLCSLIDPKQWLERALWRLREVGEKPLSETSLGGELFRRIDGRLAALGAQCAAAQAAITEIGGFDGYVVYLADLGRVLAHWREVFALHGPDALAEEAGAIEFPRLPAVRGNPAGKAVAQALLESVRKPMKEGALREMLIFSERQWREGVQSTVACGAMFLRLALEFSKRYAAAKQAQHVLDFNDLERFALHVLHVGQPSPAGDLAPSDVARQYQRQFEHVLVDEYQDINEVQDAILTLVSRECGQGDGAEPPPAGNLFAVGDVKQSIYRFRLAEPARFLRRERRFREGDGGEVIDLQRNFRSRGPLLGAVNRVFERLMTREAAEIQYDKTHLLHAGLEYPAGDDCFSGAPMELHLLDDDVSADEDGEESASEQIELERTGREAAFVARRIRAMMGMDGCPRMQVCAKGENGLALRPIRYSDIVVLLRALAYKADQYAEVLRQHGIPVHSESGTGYFESMEVRDMLALLQLLENRRQDIPLAAVLRNPVLGIDKPDDALAGIAAAYCRGPRAVAFHEAVVRYAGERQDALAGSLRGFLQRLDEWRRIAQQRPVADLLWRTYDETGYLAFCSGLHNGGQRQANLIHLHQRARQFGTFQRQGLSRFLSFLQTLRSEADLGQPSVATAAEDVVRIMSVHRSKGLEFPVVLMPDLGKRMNLSDCTGSILVDRHAGLGMAVVDETRRVRYPSLAQALVKQRLLEQNLAEELRVLYVAMTRAREHLVLVGTCSAKKQESWTAQWGDHAGALPAELVLAGRCPLDWLGPVAATAEADGADPAIEVHLHDAEALREICIAPPAARVVAEAPAALRPDDRPPEAERLIGRLGWAYPYDALTRVRAAESVTGWTKNGSEPVGYETESIRRPAAAGGMAEPRFARGAGASAAEIGSATHLVLQHLDFRSSGDGADLRRQVRRLVERAILTPAEGEMVDFDALEWFCGSEIGLLLRERADELHRELPFNLAVTPPGAAGSRGSDRIMVRGRIDVLAPDGQGFVLVDYKTDRVTCEQVKERAELYRPQIELYAQAVRTILRRPLKATHLVFLRPRVIWTSGEG